MDSEVKTTFALDGDDLKVTYEYDAEPVIEQNKIERHEFSTYKAAGMRNGMVKVATLHPGDIERLSSLGYNILSPDRDEKKRALLFIQSEQKYLMTVTGKPISKKKSAWL